MLTTTIDSPDADLHLPTINSRGSEELNLGFEYNSQTLSSSICNTCIYSGGQGTTKTN